MEVILNPRHFSEAPQDLLRHDGMTVSTFQYPSGVAALTIETGVASFTVLPFQGQQIWDARAYGRRLTMQSVFDMPLPTREFRKTYGAYFVHCGAASMGSPSPDDPHMPHGELPNIPFLSASLIITPDEISLTGTAYEREAFSHAYAFRPHLTFRAGSALIDCHVAVENIGGAAMPLMYLGHVNNRPEAGAHLVDTLPPEGEQDWSVPEALSPEAQVFHRRVAADKTAYRQIGAEDLVIPEYVTSVQLEADAQGWAHAAQVLPDGSADLVSYRPEQLRYGVRWLTRAPERQALGIILPATNTPAGRQAARNAGELQSLEPGAIWQAEMRFGTLNPDQARAYLAKLAD